jgi:hypothetical protein
MSWSDAKRPNIAGTHLPLSQQSAELNDKTVEGAAATKKSPAWRGAGVKGARVGARSNPRPDHRRLASW